MFWFVDPLFWELVWIRVRVLCDLVSRFFYPWNDSFFWELVLIRLRILRNLILRFFCPWDEWFLNSIVFDVWYIARHPDTLAEMADRAPTLIINGSDHEDLLLNDDEMADAELTSTLALVSFRGTSRCQVRKVKFTPRSVSDWEVDLGNWF